MPTDRGFIVGSAAWTDRLDGVMIKAVREGAENQLHAQSERVLGVGSWNIEWGERS